MKLADRFYRPWLYLAWLLVSTVLLAVARYTDPYVFGFAAYGTAGVSIVLISAALLFGVRPFLWAVLAAVPTVLAFVLLSTYNWA